MDSQAYRSAQLRKLPAASGVYALCDLLGKPIYVGKSQRSIAEGIRSRVRRHLTSARSDVVANRQLDVWEIAYVWAWPTKKDSHLPILEAHFFHKYDAQSRLINGTVPPKSPKWTQADPDPIVVQIISDEDLAVRLDPSLRFPRQVQQFNNLLDWVLNTKDEKHLHRALDVHFERVAEFYDEFKRAKKKQPKAAKKSKRAKAEKKNSKSKKR